MEFKGTKGEWRFHEESHGQFISSSNYCIAKINDHKGNMVTTANAKLISCAPLMLEQLKTLYSFYEELAMKINTDDFDEEFRDKYNPTMSNTEELIKKATTI